MNRFLGPILIIVGLILLEIIKLNFSGFGLSHNAQKRVESSGFWGAFFLGLIFALSFCPISAALFFGSLIPLAIKYDSHFTIPALYGLGTGLPVILFAVLISIGAQSAGKAFTKLTHFELWFRRITGIIFLLIGLYYVSVHIFKVL
jgi:cytochrome c biogenesis protein CcdA